MTELPAEGRVHRADALEALASWPDACVDHVITDPPYSERTHKPGAALSMKGGGSDIGIDFKPLMSFEFVRDLLRISKSWVICFCALEHLGEYAKAAGEAWIRAGVWDRPDGTPQLSGDRPAQGAEGIAIMHRPGRKAWNAGGKRGVWRCGVERKDREHPTQKPLALMAELVRDFTIPGEAILDPFAGSGSTGVAALSMGRRFIGCEIDPRYVRIANERIAAVVAGSDLRSHREGQGTLFGAGGPSR